MNNDILLVYLIALVILIIIVIGILIWVLTAARKKEKSKQGKESQEALQAQQVPAQLSRLPAVPGPVPHQVSPRTDKEMLRVFRDVATGLIYIEVEAQQYRKITDIRSPEVGRMVLQVVADLGRFTRGVTPAVQPGASVPVEKPASLLQPQAKPVAVQAGPGSLAKRGEALIQSPGSPRADPQAKPVSGSERTETGYRLETAPSADTVIPVPVNKEPALAPSPSMLKESSQKVEVGSFWGRILSRPNTSSTAAIGPRPLADELEDLLQEHMRNLTEVPAKEIHFRTANDGSLKIEVGGVAYSDMDSLPDPAFRDIVRDVVKKWERK